MALLCEDCGEEPQQPGKATCKWCADYNEYKAAEARAYQRYERSLLDRDLDGGGLEDTQHGDALSEVPARLSAPAGRGRRRRRDAGAATPRRWV